VTRIRRGLAVRKALVALTSAIGLLTWGCSSKPSVVPGDGGDAGPVGTDTVPPDTGPDGPGTGPDGPDSGGDGPGGSDGGGGVDGGDGGPLTSMVLGPYNLITCDGLSYAVSMNIGGQTFRLNMDTGSASVAVASTACTSCSDDPDTLYTPGSTASDTGRTTSLVYEDGSNWNGEIYTEQAMLDGMNTPVTMNLVAITSQQDFILAPTMCGDGTTYTDDGILGMGPIGSGATGTDDFIVQLARMYPGMGKAFSFQLCTNGGNLWMGGYDPAFTDGPMQFTPLLPVDPTYAAYNVEISDFQMDGQSLGFGVDDFGPSTVDSGTSDLLVPQAIFDAVVAKVQASPEFQQQITTQTDFFDGQYCLQPSVSLDMLNQKLPKVTMVLPGRQGSDPVTLQLPATSSYLSISSDPSGPYVCSGIAPDFSTVIGARVLMSTITLIDREAHLVGFAPEKGCP
jgi:hypothetical protein